MKLLKYILNLLFFVVLCASVVFAEGAEQAAPSYPPVAVTTANGTHNVQLVWVDLNDPKIKVDLSLAKNKIGTVDSLENLSVAGPNETVIASINASYFNMGRDSQPASTLILDGNIEHIAEGGSIVGFDGDNRMHTARMGVNIAGSVNNQWEWPYNWSSWNINHLFSQPEAAMIFNHHYTGNFPNKPVYVVAVQENQVVGKYDYVPIIPQNGYIIVRRDADFLDLFKVGDRVDYKFEMMERDKQQNITTIAVPFSDIENAAGAGPILIQNGQRVLDARAEGFTASKFLNGSAIRSMIGVTAQNKMAMLVTESPVSLSQLADIGEALNLVEAFNLDGGGSSGLMYRGNYLIKPKRKVSNAFVVKKLAEQPIRIVLNDIEQFFDVYPFVLNMPDAQPRTMVPLRGILEKIGADVTWHPENQTIDVQRFDTTLSFKIGEKTVQGSQRTYQMDVPLYVKDNRSFISVRFLTEYFGGTVGWDNDKKLVDLHLPTVVDTYRLAEAFFERASYQLALEQYDKVLQMFPEHVSALKKSAFIFDDIYHDQRTALSYYKRVLDIFDKDDDTYTKLAKAYRKLNLLSDAEQHYLKALQLNPKSDDAHYGLAKLYEQSNQAQAELHYIWLLNNGKIQNYRVEAMAYLRERQN